MKNITTLADWAINEVQTKYPDDVCLLLEHATLRLGQDANAPAFSHYIPRTNRANGLARTFIVEGIGRDLFPMSWERIEKMADVKDYNTKCLGHAKILWARSEEDRQRFTSLQARLQANLQNPQYMLERAKDWLKTVNEVFQDTLFEEKLYKIRENAGYICDLLAIAVAYVNGQYFVHGQTSQLQVLSQMEKVPANFTTLYKAIVEEESPDTQKHLCHQLIATTKAFLDQQDKPVPEAGQPDFSELANWYQELCYTWRRVYHWCNENDPINAYIWCCMLQNEVEEWGTNFGITDIDILSAYKADDLKKLHTRAETVEANFRQAITENGIRIDEYTTLADFLEANAHKSSSSKADSPKAN